MKDLRSTITTLLLSLACATQAQAQRQRIDLSGRWSFRMDSTAAYTDTILLPGTTDTNRKGTRNGRTDETTQLTRLYPYVGKAWYRRTVLIPKQWKGKTVTLTMERTKPTAVWIDGAPAGTCDDISTPQTYDLGERLTPGLHDIEVMVDNGQSVPKEVISSSHAYSESTQTNWNGIIGDIFLEAKERLHVADVQVTPDVASKSVRVRLSLNAPEAIGRRARVVLKAQAWNTPEAHRVAAKSYALTKGVGTYELDYALGDSAQLWSEFSPALYRLTVDVDGRDSVCTDFGLRSFTARSKQFAINGTTTFLRGKHDGCVFPLAGHTAMDVAAWRSYFKTAKAYGINHVRFHSWCPPRACFAAADIEGCYVQAELPFWGWMDKGNTRLISFLRKEGANIQQAYGNHASFVMFALGNELSGDVETMKSLLTMLRATDDRRLYAYGSNNHLGFKGFIPGQDFLVTCRVGGEPARSLDTHVRASFSFADAYDGGYLNHRYPNTTEDFSQAIGGCPAPVVSHETGQYQVFPNFREIKKYTGALYPYNMEVFRRRLADAGMLEQADDFFRASGKWAAELYKADIEMELRTPEIAGFQLLDLQDYPGQGTALVGVLDAFMESKGLVTPERWRGFCNATVPLMLAEKRCWTNDEMPDIGVKIAHYAPSSLKGKRLTWELKDADGRTADSGSLPITTDSTGLLDIGRIRPKLSAATRAQRMELSLAIDGTPHANSYGLWVYPAGNDALDDTRIMVTRALDAPAIDRLRRGGKVLWFPQHEAYAGRTVDGLFTTDYWNYRMFKTISTNNRKPVSPGTMGILTHPSHPLFNDFPTDEHTDWQWFSIVKASHPIALDAFPKSYRPIVQVIDNVERNHKFGLVFELAVEKGKLLVCMAELDGDMDKPEVRQFRNSMVRYMLSGDFAPTLHMSIEELNDALRADLGGKAIQELRNISYE